MAGFARPAGWAWWAAGIVVVALVGAILLAALRPGEPTDAPAQFAPPAAPFAPPAALPPTADPVGAGFYGMIDASWLEQAAEGTGIPTRALAAYAAAAIVKAQQMPECGLGWNTLAGIGAVESDHGRHGASRIESDGRAVPPIFGVALDGVATAHIPDSDGGTIDGDAEFDRAVGPMQLIPGTWRNWHVDGNGDGVEDPQNIDDAAVAAANYLCRASGQMATPPGWRDGIAAYNRSSSYAVAVSDAANRFADAARLAG